MIVVLIAGFALAVLILLLESKSGTVGDSSMAPCILLIMALILAIMFVVGLATGQIGVHFR